MLKMLENLKIKVSEKKDSKKCYLFYGYNKKDKIIEHFWGTKDEARNHFDDLEKKKLISHYEIVM